MKTLAHTLTGFLLVTSLLLTGCALSGMTHRGDVSKGTAAHSMEDHRAAIQHHTEQAATLEQNIQRLEQRIETMKQKPYRNPKGFRLAGWTRLVGTWREELKDLRTDIVRLENELRGVQSSKTEG